LRRATLVGLLVVVCALLTHAPVVAQSNQTRFAVVGDFGDAGQSEQDVANLINGWQPDFVITTGDNNYPAGAAATIDANIGQYYHQYIYPYTGAYGAGAPFNRFFPTLGNHDWGDAFPNPTGLQPYLDYFTLPGNERYYEFVWGPVHFFVLDSDPNEPDGMTSTSPQAQWLRARLAASNARWKLVYFHHPPYSSGPHGPNADMQWPFRAWGATAVLSGHDHDYERLNVGGLPYFVNGLGGRSLYTFGPPLPESQVRYNDDFGAMLVNTSAQTLTFQFINRAGVLIDTYTLNAPPVTSGQILISELRLRGARGAHDEFVELYNNTDTDITVAAADGSAGWAVAGLGTDGSTPVVRFIVPAGAHIPARGHYLIANSAPDGYSLGALATPDQTFNGDLPDDAGLALFRTADPTQFGIDTRLDAVGFNNQTGAQADLYRGGAGFSSLGTTNGEYSLVRKQTSGLPQDTNDDAADFIAVSPNGGTFGGTTTILGAPGPEDSASPIQRNAQMKASLIDPQQPSTSAPNRVRNQTPVTNGALGTLVLRRKFTNKTGAPVTALRFRIIDITTLNTPSIGAKADLRALDSGDETLTITGGAMVNVKGIVIEQPPAQALGGGLNTALTVNLPGGALAPNASISVQFVLGVQTGGSFRFIVNVESATGSSALRGGRAFHKQRTGKHG
jgi:tartrate-resistant acid phosphatase type 5